MGNRVATGIKALDKQLRGGLPKNQLTSLEGCSGIGKTIFGIQFLKEGLFTDERVLFVTSKDTPKQIREIISSMGWDIAWAFEQGRFLILDIRDYFGETESFDNGDIFVNLIKEIKDIVSKNKIKRVVLDPAFPQFITANNNIRKIYFSGLNDMIEKSDSDLTIVILKNDNVEDNAIETNTIKMYFDQQGEMVKRYILPQKIMFTDYAVKAISFEIKPKDGIWINE
ncbi:MAG: RAD55 family ATPase [Candidatus Margulisbacteria bacterium]|nr:RAD55 family ATPase [Candidatus Margulisiibacteriota bacterium]